MVAAKPTRDVTSALFGSDNQLEQVERFGQNVKPLFRTDASEITDGEGPWLFGARPAVSDEVQAGKNDMNARTRDGEIFGHEVGVVSRRGDEAIDLAAVKSGQSEAATSMGFRQRFQKNVVALKRT